MLGEGGGQKACNSRDRQPHNHRPFSRVLNGERVGLAGARAVVAMKS